MNMKWLIDFLDSKVDSPTSEDHWHYSDGYKTAMLEVKDFVLQTIKVCKDEKTN